MWCSLPQLCIQKWQPSPTWHHSCPQTPCKVQDHQKDAKKFIWHQLNQYVKIKWNCQKHRHTDNRVYRRFRVHILMPDTGYRSNKKPEHMLPRGLWKFLVTTLKSLKCCWCATNLTMLRLLTSPPRTEKTEKPLWKEQSSWLLESAIPSSGYAANKMNRQLMYTLCLC